MSSEASVLERSRLDQIPARIAARAPVRAHTFVMGLLFCAAAVVGFYLLPGDSERIAMLERDGKTREARAILETSFANGDRSPHTLFQLQGLYESSGDLPKARQMLELLAEERPRDASVQRQLGLFYKQTHDEAGYIRSLTQQIGLRYSETACREVIGLLRRSGAYDQERATLDSCRQKGYRRPDDMVRLASLLAVSGDIKEASVLLRAVDDLRRLKTERERLQLFDLLIENGQPAEAERRGARWVKGTKGSKDDALALTLISVLVVANRHDLAIELARETSLPGDSVFLAIPEIMIERAQTTAALGLLRGWLEKADTIEPSVAQRFIQAAMSVGEPDLAFACAQRVGLSNLGSDAILEMAQGLEAAGRKSDADGLRASIGRTANGGGAPIIKLGQRDKGRLLGQSFRIASLDGWRNGLWKRLAEQNKPPPVVAPVSAGGPLAKPQRPLHGLKALKQAKHFSTIRRRYNTGQPKKPPPQTVFDPFNLKPGQ